MQFVVTATRWRRDIKISLVQLAPVRKKFIIVSNDHGRTHKCYFFVFDRKFPSWANLLKKNRNCKTNSNIQNSIVIFTFCVIDCNYPSCANFVQQIKNFVNLRCNLVPRLIQICRSQWWCSFYVL